MMEGLSKYIKNNSRAWFAMVSITNANRNCKSIYLVYMSGTQWQIKDSMKKFGDPFPSI